MNKKGLIGFIIRTIVGLAILAVLIYLFWKYVDIGCVLQCRK